MISTISTKRLLAVALLAGTGLVSACGSDPAPVTTTTERTTTTTTGPAAPVMPAPDASTTTTTTHVQQAQ